MLKPIQITIENKYLDNATDLLKYMKGAAEKSGDPRMELGKKKMDDLLDTIWLNRFLGFDARFYFFENEDEEGQYTQSILRAVVKRATNEAEMAHFRAEVAKEN